MDVNANAKTLDGAGLFLEAVGNDQQDIALLNMRFELRAVNGRAGALFGTVRNNVQLNLSSIDGIILGELSGTIFGQIAREKGNPIRVDMVDSRYCVMGNVKDTCVPDPSYVAPGEDYNPGDNDVNAGGDGSGEGEGGENTDGSAGEDIVT